MLSKKTQHVPRSLLNSFCFPLKLIPRELSKVRETSVRPRNKFITHCIFDVDGALLNSKSLYSKIVSELCQKYGSRYPKLVQKPFFGESNRKIIETVIKDLNLSTSATIMEYRFTDMVRSQLPKVPLQNGAQKLIDHLHVNRIPMALISNLTRSTINEVVKARKSFFNKFDHIVGVDDVNFRGKPEPDLYLKAAQLFQSKADPCHCLVFDNSIVGIRGAIKAHMQVLVATLDDISEETFMDRHRHIRVIRSLEEFKPELYGLPPYQIKPLPAPANINNKQKEILNKD